jgi:hypothetical protein
VEWWTLGVFIFKLLYGVTPFKRATTPPRIYGAKEPACRLDAAAIKRHHFFNSGVNWVMLLQCATAPYVPPRRPPTAQGQGDSAWPHLGHREEVAVDLTPPRICGW